MNKFLPTLLATIGIFSILVTPSAYAAKKDPNATVVTINNQNTTEVYANVRRVSDPMKTNCLPEMKLFPGDMKTVKYGDLQKRCQDDTKFLIDAYGNTHTIAHTVLLSNTPGNCLIEHHLMTIRITCSG